MSENATENASTGEQAYFESQGEAPIEESSSTEQEATTEAQPEEHQEQQPEKPQKTVPLAALHEARAKEREAKQRIEQLERTYAEGNARLNQLIQTLQPQIQPQQPQIPDRDADPVSHFDARIGIQQRQIEQQNQFIQQQIQERAHQQQMEHLREYVRAQEVKYVNDRPDYNDAVNYLKEVDTRALMAVYGVDEGTAAAQVQSHLTALADRLARDGVNLPERVYAMAQAKGYAPKQHEVNQKLDVAKRGVAASRSLGSGSSTSNVLTIEALANMPADEFAQALKADPAVWRRAMGG